ncbi:UPF0449 protein C19orf25 homolog [Dunckerocampus dactyliophorus]|uniref:UPF0449 protein C19orf25 homolog n=1 Tax=Dunckerocampus dactyliophorus TaxID=161453 RepID=UPI002406846B|nr:UPF0449 protein C19orf25 homolog [Dunckerocampus dactyliophorus]XP_054645865.1 UPF0449 protein C19orf25 homolog [Dunckerocampus dactyliophorus]
MMNMNSRGKKRVLLPSRPSPPTVDHILEDISGAAPTDPVFSILEKPNVSSCPDEDVERTFQQCRRHVDVNQQLHDAKVHLIRQRDELRASGERLDWDVSEVKGGLL